MPQLKRNKIVNNQELINICKKARQTNKKIVMTGGIFDLLHPGHTRLLYQAKKMGDLLIIIINSDTSTKKNKGENRPINSELIRSEILSALETVDYVSIFNELTPKELIQKTKPHIWVKGGDYNPKEIPEAQIINNYGGEIKILPLEGNFSVSHLIERIRKNDSAKKIQPGSFST